MNVRWIGALSFIGLASCQDGATSTLPTALDRSPAPTAISQGGPRPGYHIVVFRADVTDAPGLARALVSAHAGTLEHTYEHAILGFSAALSDGAVAAIRRHPEVALVEQDSWVTASITQTSATWGIDRTDQRALPLDQQYTYTATGNGVNAYIIDTGIRTTHVDFGGRASAVFDAIGDGNGAVDCNGHGTHVAGTVGSATYGIAKQVRLYSVRVLNCAGSGSTSGVIAGVDWVTANHLSPAVANMSLGGGISTTLDQAVRNSVTSGVTYVVAAGNDNLDACGGSPSRVAEAITVGSTTTTDARSSFSNVGTCLDLFAPGSSITSTYGGSDVQTAILSGTSMASPHVAGAAARYLEINPAASGATVASALVGNATTGVVTSAGTGSPNRLLYTSFIDGPPVNQAPVAQFTSSCTGLTCTFNSSASTDDGGITSRSWALGDGATAGNVVSPSRTYAASGTYTVTLTVTDAGGLTGTRAAAVTVTSANTTPVAAFNVSCVNLTCTFDSSVSTDDVGITARQWFFGDGGSAGSVVSPSRTYAAAGTYNVRLNVLDGGGLWSSLTKPVTVSAGVNQPPVAQFTVTCVLLTCSFDSSGSTDDVGVVSRSWTFGDGATAGNVIATSRTYSAAGTYTVVLTVRDGPGLTATRTQAVTVTAPPPNQAPVASFTVSCTFLSCSFDSSGSTDDASIVARNWTFGDGGTASGPVVATRTYSGAGTYAVTLVVTDGAGLTGTLTQNATVTAPPPVNQPPVASFAASCTALTCTFNSSASSDDNGIVSRAWTFGDGTSLGGNTVTASRTYAAAGAYQVTLTVSDAGGLTSVATQQVTVSAPANQTPVAQFTVSCVARTCTFDSSVSTDDVGIVARQWFFGDGSTAGNVVAPTKTYAAAGTYAVRVNVLDAGGLWSSRTTQVTVP